MQPSLQGVPARPAILVFALAAGALLSYQAARLWLANHRIHSSRLEVIERGAALEPGNAEAWDLLGRHRQLDFANADPQQELADYQRAVQDDPLSAIYWMNLAGAYEANGDLGGAQHAFEQRALRVSALSRSCLELRKLSSAPGNRMPRDTPKFVTRCSRTRSC